MAELTRPPDTVSRRRVLGIAWSASLVALVAQAIGAFLRFFKPRVEEGTFGARLNVGRVEEFPPGSISHVREGRLYISHVEDGLLAIWHTCTHLGCTVPWVEDEEQFHCPCHSSLFDRKGVVTGGPAPRPLDLFEIELQDGEVVVDTGKSIQRSRYDASQATSE